MPLPVATRRRQRGVAVATAALPGGSHAASASLQMGIDLPFGSALSYYSLTPHGSNASGERSLALALRLAAT